MLVKENFAKNSFDLIINTFYSLFLLQDLLDLKLNKKSIFMNITINLRFQLYSKLIIRSLWID